MSFCPCDLDPSGGLNFEVVETVWTANPAKATIRHTIRRDTTGSYF